MANTPYSKDSNQPSASEKMLQQSFIWLKTDGRNRPATENLVPGNRVYGEKLHLKDGAEYRVWDPFRSKLAAAIMNGLENFSFANASTVLYLGVSTGTTASHISDMIGASGVLFGVEHTSRVAREFMDRVASHRTNIIPIIQDARRPEDYFAVFGKVDIIYVDIAQPDQTNIAISNCRTFLKEGGTLYLVIKTRSINAVESPERVIKQETERLYDSFDILESINLMPYNKDHAMVIARYLK